MKVLKILSGIILVIFAVALLKYFLFSNISSTKTLNFENNFQNILKDNTFRNNDATSTLDKYENFDYGFSFYYPKDFKITSIVDENNEDSPFVVNIEKPNTKTGLQISITYGYEGVLSAQKISEDLPDLKIFSAVKMRLDDKGEGIAFRNNNSFFGGDCFDVWFTKDNILFQISSYYENKKLMEDILGTWKWLDN